MEQNSNVTTIYLVRHGETESNVNKIVDGHFNASLTEQGKQQAKALGQKFKDINFAAVFASDLARARDTAELAVLDRKLAVNTTHLLRERFYGVYEGKPAEEYVRDNQEMFKKLESLSEQDKHQFRVYPSMETEEEMMNRFVTKLREIAVSFSGKTVLVVSHGTIMRTFLIHLGAGTREDFGTGSLLNTALIKLESDGVDFFVKDIIGHQRKSKLPYA